MKFKTKFEYGSFRRGYIKGEGRKKNDVEEEKDFRLLNKTLAIIAVNKWTNIFFWWIFCSVPGFISRFSIHAYIHRQIAEFHFKKIIEKKPSEVEGERDRRVEGGRERIVEGGRDR